VIKHKESKTRNRSTHCDIGENTCWSVFFRALAKFFRVKISQPLVEKIGPYVNGGNTTTVTINERPFV